MKRTISILVVLILIVGVALGIYLVHQNQDIRQHAADQTTTASQDPNVVAVVGTQGITKDMVEKAALEQYAPDAITPEVKKLVLDILIERAILDQEAAKDNITVTDDEIAQSPLGDSPSTKYEILKQKLIASTLESREAYVIGYWVPPSDYSPTSLTAAEQQKIAAIRKDGALALAEAQIRMEQNEDVLTIAQDLIKKYPSLKDTLGVNGYIVARTPDTTLLTTPRIYTRDPKSQGQPFFDTLFSMNQNEVKTALADKDAGGSVIKVVQIHHSQYATYDEFLAAKKQQLVTINSTSL